MQAAVLPRAEISCKRGENGGEAEGAVFADVILCDPDGVHRSAELSLPFLFPVKFEEGYIAEAEATVCGLSVRQRREGEAEAEATLKVTLKLYKETTAEYISEIEEGEAYKENDSAISRRIVGNLQAAPPSARGGGKEQSRTEIPRERGGENLYLSPKDGG